MSTARWGTLVLPWFRDDRRFRVLEWTVPALATVLALAAPLPTAALLVLAGLFALLWRRPAAVVPILVVLMGNAKLNVYAGFFTFFPEYAVFAVAGLVLLLRWAESPGRIEERGLMALFGAWILAGALSFVFAPMVGKVLAKAVVLALAAFTCWLVLGAVRDERQLGRALAWWEGAALLNIGYAILQMAGILLGFDTSLSFLERYGNTAMYYGIGAPAELSLSLFFRANGFFSDPNILAGFLAATAAMTLALLLHHARTPGRAGRARFEAVLFGLAVVALLLTLSRSGAVGLAAGCATVLVLEPRVLRSGRFWLAAAAGVALVGTLSAVMGTNPLLMVQRLGESLDTDDVSNRIHGEVFRYGLALLLRYPLTGVGLGNFGAFYGSEVDPYYPDMMSHCAPLSYFAESGLPGGLAFLAVVGVILWRTWRAARDPVVRAARPGLHAALAGLAGALVAVHVSNLMYDYSPRTFIWVISGLAVAAAGIAERTVARAGAAPFAHPSSPAGD